MINEHGDGLSGHLRRVRLIKTDDSGTQQKMDLFGLKSEKLEEIVRVQNFGFHSNPPVDSEGVLMSLAGRSDRAMVIGVEDKNSRPKNRPVGSTAIYDKDGNIVSIVAQNLRVVHATEIRLVAPKIVLESPDIRLGSDNAITPVEIVTDTPAAKVKAE